MFPLFVNELIVPKAALGNWQPTGMTWPEEQHLFRLANPSAHGFEKTSTHVRRMLYDGIAATSAPGTGQ
ncbi:MAG: hypothetical protein ACOC0P_05945 [Planctomycetota bacterium]